MQHGEQQSGPSSSTRENVDSRAQRTLDDSRALRILEKRPAGVGVPITPSEDVIPGNQEERDRVFQKVEQAMENFRKGQSTRFKTLTCVMDELDRWTGVSDTDRERALNTYMAEVNSDSAVSNGNRPESGSATQPSQSSVPSIGVPQKRLHHEVEDLIERLSQGGNEEEEDEHLPGRKRLKEEDMPWFNLPGRATRRDGCIQTCKTLQRFSEDLSGVKGLLRVAHNLPEGIPTPQWDRILRGESVDLNQILSSMHYIQLNDERKGRLGDAEVVFAVPESKRQIRTGAEWSAAFRRLSKAVSFLFPHREEEHREYAEYLEGLFAAKQANAHAKVILYDQSIRNQVGGGQNVLLTDYHRFHSLGEAILHTDGIEYGSVGPANSSKPGGSGKPGGKTGGKKGETCKRFNGPKGCRFSENDCYYKHACQLCGKGGHAKANCKSEGN
jgi:hypothetical protein